MSGSQKKVFWYPGLDISNPVSVAWQALSVKVIVTLARNDMASTSAHSTPTNGKIPHCKEKQIIIEKFHSYALGEQCENYRSEMREGEVALRDSKLKAEFRHLL